MRFWIREASGWVLVVLGLYAFYKCYTYLEKHYIVEAGVLTAIGFILFRGGLHLQKVAVAARICLLAEERLNGNQPKGPEKGSGVRGQGSEKPKKPPISRSQAPAWERTS